MVTQTTVQEDNAIRFGAGKLEYESDALAWVDVGWVEDAKFGDRWEKVTLKGANVGTIKIRIKNHEMFIEGKLGEVNLTTLKAIRGEIDTITPVAGDSATVTDEPVVLTGLAPTRLAHKNGAGTVVTITNVDSLAGSGGTAYTLAGSASGGDYYVGVDAQGYTFIGRTADSDIVSGSTVYVTYTYTPYASKIMKSGGKTEVTFRRWRLTNIDENGKKFQVTMKKGAVDGGLSIDLKPDDSGDNWLCPFAITGVVDGTLPVGEQLFEIEDEQNPT